MKAKSPATLSTQKARAHRPAESTRRAELERRGTKAAAEDGDAEAQFSVGAYLEHGIGAPKDQKQAAKWYEKGRGSG